MKYSPERLQWEKQQREAFEKPKTTIATSIKTVAVTVADKVKKLFTKT